MSETHMLFTWLRNRRRRALLRQPFPAEWEDVLRANVWQYESLDPAEQAKLRDDVRVLVAEKNWEGCGGLDLTDEMKVTIAGFAALLVLGLTINEYDRVLSILVYPEEFKAPDTSVTPEGFHSDEMMDLGGEAWHEGAVILSWRDLLETIEYRDDTARNVAIHEFAHQLDMRNPSTDGMPPLESRQQIERWRRVMREQYDDLVHRTEHGRGDVLDEYGAEDITEFFAVATEAFFEEPEELERRRPELYEVLRDYYRQDPAKRPRS